MLTHALGEAGSPFLVGFLIDAMEKKVIIYSANVTNVDVSPLVLQKVPSEGS